MNGSAFTSIPPPEPPVDYEDERRGCGFSNIYFFYFLILIN